MSNYSLPATTAWGNAKVYYGPALPSGQMPDLDTLINIGYIHQDEDINLEATEGDTLELIEVGGIVRDEMRQNGSLSLTFNVIGIHSDNSTAFWDATVEGTGETELITVRSLVNNNKYAVYLEPEAAGSQDMRIPYATVYMDPGYSSEQGWILPVTVNILTGPSGNMFMIGRGPSTTPPTQVGFTGVTANGSTTQTTTELTLTFSEAVTGLVAEDITLASTTGATAGALSGANPYTLAVTGITASGTVNVTVAKEGYSFTPNSQSVEVFLTQG